MILLITGATHAGKTALAQRLMEQYRYPYLSIDHLKMGLIRSGHTDLTPLSEDDALTAYLWPIVREMIKTAVENDQNLIVEGCYVPLNWAEDFTEEYRRAIRCFCLIMSENYVKNHFDSICQHANVIEQRLADDCTAQALIEDNKEFLRRAKEQGIDYLWIDDRYEIDVDAKLPEGFLQLGASPCSEEQECRLRREAAAFSFADPATPEGQALLWGALFPILDPPALKDGWAGRPPAQALREAVLTLNRDLGFRRPSTIKERVAAASAEQLLRAWKTLDFYVASTQPEWTTNLRTLRDYLGDVLLPLL